eukprot:CAMPEP_0184646338 /NCGR_PEP_ID=MMETSP0308-20130426/3034_1 /TAXON_ID=38269 /ORGANISM="Gloeochaete witrockiana, Strain SAG 46.84" /LENGTH=154 /DNA_ID=CAMNT_0027076269 /DNA_START=136 /DNA_END=600 /DNA_ORIENTATION=-
MAMETTKRALLVISILQLIFAFPMFAGSIGIFGAIFGIILAVIGIYVAASKNAGESLITCFLITQGIMLIVFFGLVIGEGVALSKFKDCCTEGVDCTGVTDPVGVMKNVDPCTARRRMEASVAFFFFDIVFTVISCLTTCVLARELGTPPPNQM